MTVRVRIPKTLKEYCHEENEISIKASSVSAALASLQIDYPSLYNSVCDETGRVRRHLNLFVNSDLVSIQNEQGMNTRLHSGDVLTIWQAVSGG